MTPPVRVFVFSGLSYYRRDSLPDSYGVLWDFRRVSVVTLGRHTSSRLGRVKRVDFVVKKEFPEWISQTP